MKKLVPPIKWHGGKHYLAKKIIGLMPPKCKNPTNPSKNDTGWLHYVEPYFGGGQVLLAMNPEGISEVVSDLNQELTTFWYVLREERLFNQFVREIQAIPFSSKEYKSNTEYQVISSVDIAIRFFIRCRQSLAGRMQGFASITRNRTRRGMNEQVSAWLNAIEGLPEVHARLKRVLILASQATDVIKNEDSTRTLFYLDPPYLQSTRSSTSVYEHEMSSEEHEELLTTLEKLKGRFLLSGYPSALYTKYEKRNGWNCTRFEIPNHASGSTTKKRMVECVWRNFQ